MVDEKTLVCQKCKGQLGPVLVGETESSLVKNLEAFKICLNCRAFHRLNDKNTQWIIDNDARKLVETLFKEQEGKEKDFDFEICDKPAENDYFYKILLILGIEENNQEWFLMIHQCQSFDEVIEKKDLYNLILFCGKVCQGETLRQALERELSVDLGIDKVIDFVILPGKEYANNRFGQKLPRARINVVVAYNRFAKTQWKGYRIEWIKHEAMDKFLALKKN